MTDLDRCLDLDAREREIHHNAKLLRDMKPRGVDLWSERRQDGALYADFLAKRFFREGK